MVASAGTHTGRALGRLLCAALAAAALTGVTGCGKDPDAGTNGVGKLPAPKIEQKARAAARQASAVRLTGKVVSRGHTYRLALHLKRTGGTGRVAVDGGRAFSLLRVGRDLYLKADAAFWTREGGGGTEVHRELGGKYVKVPAGDPAYREFSGFTDMQSLLGGLLAMTGERQTGDYGTVGGVRSIRVEAGGGDGGNLDVSLSGAPRPLRIQRGGGAGTLRFTDWDQDFALAPPARSDTVDYG